MFPVSCRLLLLLLVLVLLATFQVSLGVASSGVSHGNYKWKNMGATMWKAKQAGKDPKFWKKDAAMGGSGEGGP
jgi:hypothetical protein